MSKRNINININMFDKLSSIETALHHIDKKCPGFSSSVYHIDIDEPIPKILVDDSEAIYEFLESLKNLRSWINTSKEYSGIAHHPRDFMVFCVEDIRILVNGRKQINWVYLTEVIKDYVERRLPRDTDYNVKSNIRLISSCTEADYFEHTVCFWAKTPYYIYYEENSGVFRIENFSEEVIRCTEEFDDILRTVLGIIKGVYK